MKCQLLIIALFPIWAAAQEVKPVLSRDYQALINDTTHRNKKIPADSTNSLRGANLRYFKPNYEGEFTVGKITLKNDRYITLHPVIKKGLAIGGAFSSTAELHAPGRKPATQKDYVQGRSMGGSLNWQGPETNEQFSFGPSINTLKYDGSSYPFDINGRLVSNGNGNKANAYDNGVLRNGSLFVNALTVYLRYKKNYQEKMQASIKAGQGLEQTIITTNKNKAGYFSVSAETARKPFRVSGSYNFRQERYSHNNRNGFLNRVYQNSLLSPVSFSTRQGNKLGNGQRSFSLQADNSFFLLEDNSHSFLQQQQTGNLLLEQKLNKVKIKLSQSFEKLRQNSREGFQPGTAFFPAGIAVQRITRDDHYFLNANMLYAIHFENYHYRGQATLNYVYADNQSAIDYAGHSSWRYQRSSHDIALSFSPDYNNDGKEAGMTITNKIYASNTGKKDAFFLPGFSVYGRFYRPFNMERSSMRLFGSFNRFNNELPIDRSFAAVSQSQYRVADVLQWLPLTEINGFNNLRPIKHREWSAGFELYYKAVVTFTASWFTRQTRDDMFPVIGAGQMNLVNMASHQNRGVELELSNDSWIWGKHKLGFGNSISFSTCRSRVTDVKEGYNFTPVAGFRDVHKTIVKGQPLGVLVGNRWLRNEDGQVMIGHDGFPLVNNVLAVIGDPTPDFTVKMNHRLSYKSRWEMAIDWEWKKGGDQWNGTQAFLDYYGRSANSASLRNTTNYIFEGALANGSHNTIPVNFYDPSLPVEQNRWVRYGAGGVAEDYIQKADCIRLQTISVSFKPMIKKWLRELSISMYANNIIVWSAYKGTDTNQMMYDQPGTTGLDFFNLPSVTTVGFNVSIQF